ncbi:hypothetical protein EW146_g5586 [Bondarzewia mesenterica]|uniref:fumarate reductase (NADH) n=1 Tax=Bondarzewia mesenterica TaxID=1095465 RepID=A0A4S4LS35_9AGAM|nr:hypothetical protein EW146_g5586 [Bondarzewia mesenterica]
MKFSALFAQTSWFTLLSVSTLAINVSIPAMAPTDAPFISPSHFAFSIEQDRWVDWAGRGIRNNFFYNVLNNLKSLSGQAVHLRIGADSEDHTNFNPAVQVIYRCLEGTQVVWGVNLRQANLTAAFLEARAIAQAFASSEVKGAGVTLNAIEVGNEADLYPGNTPQNYVSQWTKFAMNVSAIASAVLEKTVPFWAGSFAFSSHSTSGFSPQFIINDGILDSEAGSRIATISQHHYSGSFCSANNGVLQDLMTKSTIRGNLTAFSPDIKVVQNTGLAYVLGETNSYSCHGAPGVSNTAGAALWALDYALFASQLGISRVYFHEGVGYKYNFIQPVTLNRSILDGSPLSTPQPPHIQPLYYAAILGVEAIGPSGSTKAVELDVGSSYVSGYAFFDNGKLARAVFVNLKAFVGTGSRGTVKVMPEIVGSGAPSTMVIKRLSIPFANATKGVTWGGQTYETSDGKVQGSVNITTVPIVQGVDVHDTEVILHRCPRCSPRDYIPKNPIDDAKRHEKLGVFADHCPRLKHLIVIMERWKNFHGPSSSHQLLVIVISFRLSVGSNLHLAQYPPSIAFTAHTDLDTRMPTTPLESPSPVLLPVENPDGTLSDEEAIEAARTRVILVGIGGATCSGKTTLAKHLRRLLPNSFIIHQDDFAPPQDTLPIHPTLGVQDWDSAPTAIDWPRMRAFLYRVKESACIPADHISHDHLNEQTHIPVPTEVYERWKGDFETIQKEMGGKGKRIVWGLVDGRADGLVLQEVVSTLDARIFLRVPHDVLLQSESENTFWQDPPGYFEDLVWPAYVEAHRKIFENDDLEHGVPRMDGLILIEPLKLGMGEIIEQCCIVLKGVLESVDQNVIVVGGGLAGLSAAHTLLERGANVLLLDKQGFMGGNSTKATSGINGAGTQPQQELGIPDSAKIFFEDTKRSARELARDDIIRVLTGRSADAVHWLQDKFNLDLSKVARLGGHSLPRTHRGNAQFPGMVMTYAQMERLEDLAVSSPDRVKILKKARVIKLIKDESGAVTGVEYSHKGKTEAAYGPVILATGGYAADFTEDSLLKKYRPEYYDLPTTNGDHCTGDGQKLALAIGASAIDLEKVQIHPTGLVDPKEPEAKVKFLAAEALRGVGGLLLDNEGQRFVDELQHRDFVTGKMWENGKYPIRLVLNGPASKEIEWHCKHYVGRGLMKKFESGEALAKEMGLKPEALKKTFDDYNTVVRTKKDPFNKKFFSPGEWKMNDIFNVAIMTPVLHYTMGGLEIDPESRVIDKSGKPIPGLFAAGEVAGGVHGANRLGGSSLLGCVVFGRVSGDSASAYLLQRTGKIAEQAASRLGAVAGHLEASSPAPLKPSGTAAPSAPAASSGGAKTFTAADVAKHNKKDDVWVIVDGQVLDVTSFLPDHPGGEKAILLYAGRDATEEFNMLHDPKVIPRYAPDAVIGTLKKNPSSSPAVLGTRTDFYAPWESPCPWYMSDTEWRVLQSESEEYDEAAKDVTSGSIGRGFSFELRGALDLSIQIESTGSLWIFGLPTFDSINARSLSINFECRLSDTADLVSCSGFAGTESYSPNNFFVERSRYLSDVDRRCA